MQPTGKARHKLMAGSGQQRGGTTPAAPILSQLHARAMPVTRAMSQAADEAPCCRLDPLEELGPHVLHAVLSHLPLTDLRAAAAGQPALGALPTVSPLAARRRLPRLPPHRSRRSVSRLEGGGKRRPPVARPLRGAAQAAAAAGPQTAREPCEPAPLALQPLRSRLWPGGPTPTPPPSAGSLVAACVCAGGAAGRPAVAAALRRRSGGPAAHRHHSRRAVHLPLVR